MPADATGQSDALSDFVDSTVTPALAAALPDTPTPMTATIENDKPTLRSSAA